MRPSKNTDKSLLKAAREILLEKGTFDFGMREVAKRSGVNMGMFYYHFKDKDDFIEHLLQEFYEGFISELKLDADKRPCALENLKSALVYIGNFAVKHRQILTALFLSAANGDKVANKFFKKNFIRHIRVLIDLIKKAQKQGKLRQLSPFILLSMLMGGINAPSFAYQALSKGPLGASKLKLLGATKENIWSEEAVLMRVELLIAAFTSEKK